MLITVILGTIIGDILWYLIGSHLAKFLSLRRWVDKIMQPLDKQIKNYPFRTIFISKFAYGLHHLILLYAGNINIPLKNFVLTDIPATIFWITTVGGLGYVSSASFILLKHYIKFAEISFALGFIILLIILHVLHVRILNKK